MCFFGVRNIIILFALLTGMIDMSAGAAFGAGSSAVGVSVAPVQPTLIDFGPSLVFTDNHDGWYESGAEGAEGGGTLFHTTNGGRSWAVVTGGTNVGPSVDFVNSTDGWISGGQQGILHTVDGGATWKLIRSPNGFSNDEIVKTEFLNPHVGFGLTEGEKLLLTANSGRSWHPVDVPPPAGRVEDLCFSNDQIGFISTENGVYATSDGGSHWMSSDPYFQLASAFPISCAGTSAVLEFQTGHDMGMGEHPEIAQVTNAFAQAGEVQPNAWTTPIAADFSQTGPASQQYLLNAGIDPDLIAFSPGTFLVFGSGPEAPATSGPEKYALEAYKTMDGGESFTASTVVRTNGSPPYVAGLASVPGTSRLFVIVWSPFSPAQTFLSTDSGVSWTLVGQYDFTLAENNWAQLPFDIAHMYPIVSRKP